MWHFCKTCKMPMFLLERDGDGDYCKGCGNRTKTQEEMDRVVSILNESDKSNMRTVEGIYDIGWDCK